MSTLKVEFVLEAVMCDHCDTYFGIPLTFDGRAFYCPVGHLNAARKFGDDDEPAEDDEHTARLRGTTW